MPGMEDQMWYRGVGPGGVWCVVTGVSGVVGPGSPGNVGPGGAGYGRSAESGGVRPGFTRDGIAGGA